MMRRKKKTRHRKSIPGKPGPRWRRYLVIAGLAIMGSVCSIKLWNTQEKQTEMPSRSASLTIPRSSLRIEGMPLNKEDQEFKKVESIVESHFEKSSAFPGIAYRIRPQDSLQEILMSIKESLKAKGFGFVSEYKTQEAIFEAIFDYYERNNRFILIRTSRSGLKSFWKFPIDGKALHSFSGFDGKISWERIPVYYINLNAPEFKIPEAFPSKHGIVAFIGFEKHFKSRPGVDLKKGIDDVVLHEGMHMDTIRRAGVAVTEFDFDKYKPDNSSEKDELKAFLVQMIYGTYPSVAVDSLMLSNVQAYGYAKRTVLSEFKEMLAENPGRKARYEAGENLSDEEIRKFAYRTFLKYFNLK